MRNNRLPAYLCTVLVSILIALMAGCAQTPVSLLKRDSLNSYSPFSQPSENTNTSSEQQKETVVIFIYPETGPVSAGQYYRLPLTTPPTSDL